MAVTADQEILKQDGGRVGLPVLAAKTLYGGTCAFIDAAAGYVTDVINSGANKFAGIVRSQADNSSGANGDINVELEQEGVFRVTTSGMAITDVGKKLYVSDNYTFTTTSTSNTYIGTIVEFISATVVGVKLDVQLP